MGLYSYAVAGNLKRQIHTTSLLTNASVECLLYWLSQLLVSSRTEVDLELVLSSPVKKVGKMVILIFFFFGGGD